MMSLAVHQKYNMVTYSLTIDGKCVLQVEGADVLRSGVDTAITCLLDTIALEINIPKEGRWATGNGP
jgi:hypothetical protein